ncbi:ubiquitin-specific protease ubp1 [Friedmanniomyces endolithicus]|nr:ubiquitin-specific protease ubp1 [Friedmanniomyces endolithicus]
MDYNHHFQAFHLPGTYPSPGATLGYAILALYLIHQALVYFNCPILSPPELLWNAIVYVIPARLLLDCEKRQQFRNSLTLSQMQAAKSEALRRMLGWSTGALSHQLTGGDGLIRRMSILPTSVQATSDAPPGLGNWDNSCYQNSVLQGLASLGSLASYLQRSGPDAESTSISLRDTMLRLNDAANNGKQLWTPAKLKSMSSWQQQDAQEYFSKIMDELDKEAARSVATKKGSMGLECAVHVSEKDVKANKGPSAVKNPLEGLLAQRVACTRCGFSEGLSMIPFNCLTLPLGSNNAYDLDDCLDEYTKLEEINDVDCPKCTLLRAEGQLGQMISVSVSQVEASESATNPSLSLPPELRVIAAKRLQAIQHPLDNDDYADKTMGEVCQIPKKAHVSTTKTRQAVIGRAPRSLTVHVNRSLFDELTGVQRKNYASVRFPMVLNLGSWTLGGGPCEQPMRSMLEDAQNQDTSFRLKAVVTHYGRHENGHYICYRRHPLPAKADTDLNGLEAELEHQEQWWRLSDEDVSAVTESDVLNQGGVFMLFYEREEVTERPLDRSPAPKFMGMVAHGVASVAKEEGSLLQEPDVPGVPIGDEVADLREIHEVTPTPAVSQVAQSRHDHDTTRPANEFDSEDARDDSTPKPHQSTRKLPSPPLMRTAYGRRSSRHGSMGDTGFGSPSRAVTAS